MFSDSREEDLNHGVPSQSDEDVFMVDGPVPKRTGSHNRVKMFVAALVLAGVVLGAVVASQESVPQRVEGENFEPDQKWECVHWTPTDNMARRANANERRLCENKGTIHTNSQYVYKPFGLTCQGGCHCCTRQRWSCAPWTKSDLRARESNADERLLCENKQTALKIYKYKPNGKTCGNGAGCLCCTRGTVHAALTPLANGAKLPTGTCSKIQVSAAAADATGDYLKTTCTPPVIPHKAGSTIFSFNGDTACTKILYLPATGNWKLQLAPAPGAVWTSSGPDTKAQMTIGAGSWSPTTRVSPKFACAA